MGTVKYEDEKKLLMIHSTSPHLMMWACVTASGIGSFVFLDVTADCSLSFCLRADLRIMYDKAIGFKSAISVNACG